MLNAIRRRLRGPIRLFASELRRSTRPSAPLGTATGARLKTFEAGGHQAFPFRCQTQRARIELYRFMRDNIPILSSVIWTWVRLCAADHGWQIIGGRNGGADRRVEALLRDLDHRIFGDNLLKRGGFSELLLQFFESLFTDGAVCGELRLSPSRRRVDSFAFADMRSIEIETGRNALSIYQLTDSKRVRLNNNVIFYYGLGASPSDAVGRSLLQSVPFVARVEQTLVTDMYRAMHNAGYQRIHVKISPPDRRGDESDADYAARANSYFDETVDMMRDFGPDKNPVTWDDVKIEYIGPAAKISQQNAWYINHKAMIEDVCAGTHLAPFMLGYSYGSTFNRAEFKYELVQRQVRTVQTAALALLDWIANVELALAGVDAEVRYRFDNRPLFGRDTRAGAEKIQLDNILTKLNNNLITRDQALREIDQL